MKTIATLFFQKKQVILMIKIIKVILSFMKAYIAENVLKSEKKKLEWIPNSQLSKNSSMREIINFFFNKKET